MPRMRSWERASITGPDVGRRIGGVAQHQLGGQRGDPLDELVGDVAVDDQPGGRGAALAGGAEGAEERAVGGQLEVGVGQHDHAVLAPELERHQASGPAAMAAAATLRPVGTEPVKLTAPMPGWVAMAAPGSPWPWTTLSSPAGMPASTRQATNALGAQRRLLGRLQHDAVAGQQGREELPRRDGHREVPRRDHPDHADGVARRPGQLVGQLRGHRLRRGRSGPGRRRSGPCRRPPARRRPPRPAPCPPRGDQHGQLGLALGEHLGRGGDQLGPGGDGHLGPGALGVGRGRHGLVDRGGRESGRVARTSAGRAGLTESNQAFPESTTVPPDTVADANGLDTPVRDRRSGCNPCSAHEPIVTSVPPWSPDASTNAATN